MLTKTTAAVVTSVLMICSTACWAADPAAPTANSTSETVAVSSKAPLAPGGAAGVHGAQSFGANTVVVVGGLAVLGVGVALLTSGGGHDHSSLSSTSTPSSGAH